MGQKPDMRQEFLDAQGHVLVLGGPGSGKTTIALRKAVRRIEEGLLPGQAVLFLSFSRAAVARIAQVSKTEVPKEKRGYLSIQTFHSFCWEILRSHGYLLGAPKKLQILLPHDEKALSGGIQPGSAEWSKWEKERERLFLEEGRTAFDLFAPKAADLLMRSTIIRNLIVQKYPLIIVDEAQDTGPDAWRCIEILASYVQVVCLADLEQQIFDYLPGVGPERINRIKKTLMPLLVDLGGENNRSPGTEIVTFANDIFICRIRKKLYKGVSILSYNPKNPTYAEIIRMALGRLYHTIKKETGQPPENCAFLAPTGSGVARISAALNNGDKPIPHKVLFDEAEVLLSSRLAAFLLEPKTEANHYTDIAQGLELMAAVRRAGGTKKGISMAVKLLRWAEQIRQGQKKPKCKAVAAMDDLIKAARTVQLTGNPGKDWRIVKKILNSSADSGIRAIAEHLDYLVAFNRGKRIASNLSAMWANFGSYIKAREALDEALAEDAILSGIEDLSGIHVMTIHRSKGKQFDGVIIFGEKRYGSNGLESSFIWRDDPYPYNRSRKILRVAITRACYHVLILVPTYPACPIISPYKL